MKITKIFLTILLITFGGTFCSLVPKTTTPPAPQTSAPPTFYNPCPEGCAVTEFNGLTTVTNTFDAAGNIISSSDGRTFSYDANRNITSITGGTNPATYTYLNGKLDTVVDTSGTTVYTWGANGFVASSSFTATGGTIPTVITYTYDSQNRLTSDSSGSTYSYDSYSRISSMTATGISVSFSYDTSGQLSSESLMGLTVNYSYDSNGNLTSASMGGASSSTYTYNAGTSNERPSVWLSGVRYLYGLNFGLM